MRSALGSALGGALGSALGRAVNSVVGGAVSCSVGCATEAILTSIMEPPYMQCNCFDSMSPEGDACATYCRCRKLVSKAKFTNIMEQPNMQCNCFSLPCPLKAMLVRPTFGVESSGQQQEVPG